MTFSIISLPGVVMALDAETAGSVALVRSPSSAELAAMEAAAGADDIGSGLAVFYGLAALTPAQALALPDAAREAIDNVIISRIAQARSARITLDSVAALAERLGVRVDAADAAAKGLGVEALSIAVLEAAAALRNPN